MNQIHSPSSGVDRQREIILIFSPRGRSTAVRARKKPKPKQKQHQNYLRDIVFRALPLGSAQFRSSRLAAGGQECDTNTAERLPAGRVRRPAMYATHPRVNGDYRSDMVSHDNDYDRTTKIEWAVKNGYPQWSPTVLIRGNDL